MEHDYLELMENEIQSFAKVHLYGLTANQRLSDYAIEPSVPAAEQSDEYRGMIRLLDDILDRNLYRWADSGSRRPATVRHEFSGLLYSVWAFGKVRGMKLRKHLSVKLTPPTPQPVKDWNSGKRKRRAVQ